MEYCEYCGETCECRVNGLCRAEHCERLAREIISSMPDEEEK